MSKLDNKCFTFIKLDEDFILNDKILDLLDDVGEEGVGVYLMLLPIFNKYEEWAYRIPCDELEKIRKRYFRMSEERFHKILDSLIKNRLFISDGILLECQRRSLELIKREEIKCVRKEAGKKGLESRWKKEKEEKKKEEVKKKIQGVTEKINS